MDENVPLQKGAPKRHSGRGVRSKHGAHGRAPWRNAPPQIQGQPPVTCCIWTERGRSKPFQMWTSHLEQVEINLLGVGIFFPVDTGKEILHIQHDPQQSVHLLLRHVLQVRHVSSCGQKGAQWESAQLAPSLQPGFSACGVQSARGEGERVLALESREGTRASRRVEEGLSRSLSGGGASQLLAFSPGKEQAAGVWETPLRRQPCG